MRRNHRCWRTWKRGSAIFGVHVAEAKANRFATVHTKAQNFRRSNTRPLSRRKYFSVVVSKQATRRSVMGRIKPSSQRKMSEKDKWTEASEVLSIFPTFVWKFQLTSEFRQRVNSNILQVINQIKPDLAEIPPGASW